MNDNHTVLTFSEANSVVTCNTAQGPFAAAITTEFDTRVARYASNTLGCVRRLDPDQGHRCQSAPHACYQCDRFFFGDRDRAQFCCLLCSAEDHGWLA
ncbi:hypothetical protein GOP47_0028671 [Adiantum capillus-veneris]|nr:hypothetical protein GOP47_0028671 [Adiantum capillus-veneris]